MMPAMNFRRLLIATLFSVVCLAPLTAHAQKGPTREQEVEGVDVRLYGYPSDVAMPGSTALCYFALVALGLVALGTMFKDSRRSHLD